MISSYIPQRFHCFLIGLTMVHAAWPSKDGPWYQQPDVIKALTPGDLYDHSVTSGPRGHCK